LKKTKYVLFLPPIFKQLTKITNRQKTLSQQRTQRQKKSQNKRRTFFTHKIADNFFLQNTSPCLNSLNLAHSKEACFLRKK